MRWRWMSSSVGAAENARRVLRAGSITCRPGVAPALQGDELKVGWCFVEKCEGAVEKRR